MWTLRRPADGQEPWPWRGCFEDAQSARNAVMHGNASNFMGREINVREDRMQGGLGGLEDGGSM